MVLKVFNPVDDQSETPVAISNEDHECGRAMLAAFVDEVKQTHEGTLFTKIKPKEYAAGAAIYDAPPTQQVAIAVVALRLLVNGSFLDPQKDFAHRELAKSLLRRDLPYDNKSILELLSLVEQDQLAVSVSPTLSIIANVERHVRRQGLSKSVRNKLQRLSQTYHPEAYSSDERKLGDRIHGMLNGSANDTESRAFDLNTGEAWTDALVVELGELSDTARENWHKLLEHCKTAKSSRPTKKWLKACASLVDPIGRSEFTAVVCPTLGKVGQPGESQKLSHGGYVRWTEPTEVHSTHIDMLRGLVWATALVDDEVLIGAVGDAAEKCFQKIREIGPRCPKVGNACLIALCSMPNAAAIAQLGRLRSRAKHASTRKQIARAFERAAANAGMTEEDLAEIAVPTFGMSEIGRFTQQLKDFTAEVVVNSNSKPMISWVKADGKRQKTVPAAVKSHHADALKSIRKKAKDIGALMPSVRNRIEQLFLAGRSWPLDDFRKRFLDHPLVAVVARRLIWHFQAGTGEKATAAWREDQFVDASDQPVQWIDDQTTVSIWHPLHSKADEVLRWRDWLETHEISQPFKQAHREVYVLTDAERETAVYSNRFAAHIVRQHQLASLCQQRGWRYELQGDWDSCNAPCLQLPQHDLQVEFFVEPLGGLNEVSESFIYVHLSTDQVRFQRIGSYDPLPLTEIPPLAFSEVMRDVDLFVGVTSVGNDPNWEHRGAEEPYHNYWDKVSFGELSQTAVTRKETLRRVIPRLKISNLCCIEGRFLVVKGKLRTYKIHLGSGNVLMSPNDQYLCIVQKRGSGAKRTDSIYLPFEGDNTLSLILSKAFLLAEDDKITDATIADQIRTD